MVVMYPYPHNVYTKQYQGSVNIPSSVGCIPYSPQGNDFNEEIYNTKAKYIWIGVIKQHA
jgi:hypothetical protein